jgi:hypothetical protein
MDNYYFENDFWKHTKSHDPVPGLGAIWLRQSYWLGRLVTTSKVAEYMLIQLRRTSSTVIHSAL